MLTKLMALAYGNGEGIWESDRAKDEMVLKPYSVKVDLVSNELSTVINQMADMADLYARNYSEHVSVGQFCIWAGVGPELFPLLKAYAQTFYEDKLAFYELENPYSKRGHVEEFIATPETAADLWGAKQFQPPVPKPGKQASKAKNKNPKK
jgi:hypothetical protein